MKKNNKSKDEEKFIYGKSKTCIIEFLRKLGKGRIFARIIDIRKKEPNMREPAWFTKYREQQMKFNQQVVDFMVDQREFNKQVIKRLDNVEHRLDKLEENVDTIFDILKRVDHRLDNLDNRINNLVKKNNLKE